MKKIIIMFIVCLAILGCDLNKETVINVESVSVSTESITGTVGDDGTLLLALITPGDATNLFVVWSSSNEEIATVSDEGLISFIKEGVATITVTTDDGGFTATCDVTVNPGLVPMEDLDQWYLEQVLSNIPGRSSRAPSNIISKDKYATTYAATTPDCFINSVVSYTRTDIDNTKENKNFTYTGYNKVGKFEIILDDEIIQEEGLQYYTSVKNMDDYVEEDIVTKIITLNGTMFAEFTKQSMKIVNKETDEVDNSFSYTVNIKNEAPTFSCIIDDKTINNIKFDITFITDDPDDDFAGTVTGMINGIEIHTDTDFHPLKLYLRTLCSYIIPTNEDDEFPFTEFDSQIEIYGYSPTVEQATLTYPESIGGNDIISISSIKRQDHDDSGLDARTYVTTLNLPTSLITIGRGAFANCVLLETINNLDDVKDILHNAFLNCEALTSITIPDSVQYMGSNIFLGCTNLTDITCEITEDEATTRGWDSTWADGCDATITWAN